MREKGLCNLGLCPYICVCECVYMTKISLIGNLVVDSPFQTLAVDFKTNLWSVHSRNTFLVQ